MVFYSRLTVAASMSANEAYEQTHADAPDTPHPATRRYFVTFEGNQSKRWDGKEVELDGGWLESLYSWEELTAGRKLSLSWPGKGKKVTNWSVVYTC